MKSLGIFSKGVKCLCLLLCFAYSYLPAQPSQPSKILLLEYERESTLMNGPDNVTRLQVFADGRVLLHHPIFMQSSGDHMMMLSAIELKQLMQEIYALKVDTFDLAEVKAEMAQIKARQALNKASSNEPRVRHLILDEDVIYLRIATDDGFHEVGYFQLEMDTLNHPELQTLINLSTATSLLDGLMKDTRMLKVAEVK